MSGVHLHLHQLVVGYNGRALIHGIEIGVRRGEIVTLIGPNGAGKSTILKSITRQLEPIDGKVLLEMKNLLQFTPGELARCMAVVLTGRIQTELMTCRDVTAMGRYPYTGRLGILSPIDEKKVDEALAAVHAEHLAERPFDAVSDGERQRILLARAICQEPEIIVLDEPTSFLDIRHKLELLSILHKMAKQEQITVVMSLHETDLAMKISDRIICVKGDRIFACGAPGEVLNDEVIRQLYDLDPVLGRFDTQTGSLELNFVKNRKPGEDKDIEKDKDKVVKGWEDKDRDGRSGILTEETGKTAPRVLADNRSGILPEEKGISAPRVLIAAPGSGSGKTLVTCGILRLLQKKGFSPVAFKCGPDYIDPMFHRQVLGIPSRNLDTFFSPDGQTLEILQKAVRKNKADIAIIEGVMGYFDGTGKTGMEASSFDLAMQTQTPVILLVNAKGMGRSIVSLIKGFCDYEIRAAEKLPILGADKRAEKQAEKLIGELIEEPIEEPIEESIEESSIDESIDESVDKTPNKTTDKTAHTSPGKIRGVILNRISPGMAPVMKKWIEEETGLSVVGYLPQDTYFSWGSRHLGLMQPEEIADFQAQIDRLADKLETTLDTELLLKIGREASESDSPVREEFPKQDRETEESLSVSSVQEESSEQNPETKKSLSVSLVQEELAEQNLEPEKNLRSSPVRIAVARDEAFNFYYEDNLELLQECGSDLVFFSPIHDSELPEADGLILGGGYPELYAQSLAENTRMKEHIRTRVTEGMPVLAECGGFMYLQEYLEVTSDEKQASEKQAPEKQYSEKQNLEKQDSEKQNLEKQDSGEHDSAGKSVKPLCMREPQKTHEPQRTQETQSIQKSHKTQEPQRTQKYTMCGILKGTCKKTDHLVRFGYIEISPKSESGAGTVIRGHEFHYFDSTNNGAYCTAVKPGGKRTWDCMIVQGNVVAGFPHLYYRSNPGFINKFLDRCRMYSGWKIRKTDGEDKEKDNEKSNAIAVSKQG